MSDRTGGTDRATRRPFLRGTERRVDERMQSRRARVKEMLRRGEKMIAETLGVGVRMVWRDAKKIYRSRGVRTRAELIGSASVRQSS